MNKVLLFSLYFTGRAKTAANTMKSQIFNLNETFNSQQSLQNGYSKAYMQRLALQKQREIAAS